MKRDQVIHFWILSGSRSPIPGHGHCTARHVACYWDLNQWQVACHWDLNSWSQSPSRPLSAQALARLERSLYSTPCCMQRAARRASRAHPHWSKSTADSALHFLICLLRSIVTQQKKQCTRWRCGTCHRFWPVGMAPANSRCAQCGQTIATGRVQRDLV